MVGIAYTDHIRRESGRVAEVLATADLAATVPTCPDWTAGDLLWHPVAVQWYWGTIALERLDDPQRAEDSKPARPGTGAASACSGPRRCGPAGPPAGKPNRQASIVSLDRCGAGRGAGRLNISTMRPARRCSSASASSRSIT